MYCHLAFHKKNNLRFRYLDVIENALAVGDVVLIENIEESVDPVLGPLLGRETIKKGRYEIATSMITNLMGWNGCC